MGTINISSQLVSLSFLSLGPSTWCQFGHLKSMTLCLKVKHQEPGFQIPPSVFPFSGTSLFLTANRDVPQWQKAAQLQAKTLQFASLTTQEN